jgi:cytidylate kinase
MAIVLISSLYQGGRAALAEALARKTSWPTLSREELQEEARKRGIKVGRLEVAVMKKPALSERLSREKDLYLSFITSVLCEKALKGDLIYTGRAGHLMLPGVSHRLRVGLTAPREERILRTSRVLNLSMDKAEKCLEQLDGDIDKWIHWVHQVDGRNPGQFDAVFNLENMAVSNAASVLCAMADLPDFAPTPASTKKLKDLHLTSRAKLRLALSESTDDADLQVHAEDGVVTVTYPPHQDGLSNEILKVLSDLEGCREIQCTMAESNILWIGERFDTTSAHYREVVQLAKRWGAAVELLCPVASDEEGHGDLSRLPRHAANGGKRPDRSSWPAANGGVEDDEPGDEPSEPGEDSGLDRTEDALLDEGRFGGRHTVYEGYEKIPESLQGYGNYSLVIIGDVFVSKGHSTQTRRTRELAMSIRDRLKAPVITLDMLKSRFMFGAWQAVKLVGFLIPTLAVYFAVFTNQQQVLDFLSGPAHEHNKWLASLVLAFFIPVIAYLYGTITELALKIVNID